MKQFFHKIIQYLSVEENRKKIKRLTLKAAWYCTLASLVLAAICGVLLFYCLVR